MTHAGLSEIDFVLRIPEKSPASNILFQEATNGQVEQGRIWT